MNESEARQLVTKVLIKRGAACKTDTNHLGKMNIIVTWRTTTWRILVIPLKVKIDTITIKENNDIKTLKAVSAKNKQKAVVAYVFPNCDILYYDSEKGNTIRPRCLVKRRRSVTS